MQKLPLKLQIASEERSKASRRGGRETERQGSVRGKEKTLIQCFTFRDIRLLTNSKCFACGWSRCLIVTYKIHPSVEQTHILFDG